MEKTHIKEIARVIAGKDCVLFAGAGLTKDGGGATWSELVQYLKDKFKYTSPLIDNFKIMGDMCRKYGDRDVYLAVQDRLKDVKLPDFLSEMMKLHWFTTFTTNYDTALDNTLIKYQERNVRIILTGQEFALSGLESEILCVKLMGCSSVLYGEPGSMVLDAGDLGFAKENRYRIFDTLISHAANLSFLFVGYSFNDNLFLDILARLSKSLGRPKNTHYAIFQEEPDVEKRYELEEQFNVKIIVGDLKSICNDIVSEVLRQAPKSYINRIILTGAGSIPISTTKIGGFLTKYDLVLSEKFTDRVDAAAFFKGETHSFYPFKQKWQYGRKEVGMILETLKSQTKDYSIIAVVGSPGSGRRFIILDVIYNLIMNNNCIAIRMSSSFGHSFPSIDEINELMKEITESAVRAGVDTPKQIIFWVEAAIDDDAIARFIHLADNIDFKTLLIYKNLKHVESQYSEDMLIYDIDTDMESRVKQDLAGYIGRTVYVHRFLSITKEETVDIVDQEKKFLPIIYRTIDPARRSIDRIIEEDLGKVDHKTVRECIALCSMATYLGLEMPITVLRKTLMVIDDRVYSFPDVFDLLDEAKMFLYYYEDAWANTLVLATHYVVAKRLIEIFGTVELDKLLLYIVEAVDLETLTDANFIGGILIDKGVKRYLRKEPLPFSINGMEKALNVLKIHQPARPIIHHLARFYEEQSPADPHVIELLKEALYEPKKDYALTERRGNIQTTLANALWKQNKERLVKMPINSPEILEILSYLRSARREDAEGIHPYYVEVRILKDLVQNSDDIDSKLSLASDAINIARQALELPNIDRDNENKFNIRITEIMNSINPVQAEKSANRLLEKEKNGIGFYALAHFEYKQNADSGKALIYLDKAMSGETYPAEAIALKLEILLKEDFPNYAILLKYVNLLSARVDFSDTWRSAYQKAVVFTINGKSREAEKNFRIANRLAPEFSEKRVQIYWKDAEAKRRKIFSGRIEPGISVREGRIGAHKIEGWQYSIYFNPGKQQNRNALKSGLIVDFELGFSQKGPIAFDIRPHTEKS